MDMNSLAHTNGIVSITLYLHQSIVENNIWTAKA